MPEHSANMYALQQITAGPQEGYIPALARHPDEVEALKAAGAHVAFDSFAQAGAGFAAEVEEKIEALIGAGGKPL